MHLHAVDQIHKPFPVKYQAQYDHDKQLYILPFLCPLLMKVLFLLKLNTNNGEKVRFFYFYISNQDYNYLFDHYKKKSNTPSALSTFFFSFPRTPKIFPFWYHNPRHTFILFSSEVVFPLMSDTAFWMLKQNQRCHIPPSLMNKWNAMEIPGHIEVAGNNKKTNMFNH